MDKRIRVGTPRSYRIEKPEQEEIVADYQAGLSCRAIARKYSRTHSCVSLLLQKKGFEIKPSSEWSLKYTLNEGYFSTIDSHKKAYWLGWLMADGWVNTENSTRVVGMNLQRRDRYILEEFKKDIGSDAPIIDYDAELDGKIYPQSLFRVCSVAMVDNLSGYGIVARKSKVNSPPSNIPKEFMGSFVLGEFEGDGGFNFVNGYGSLSIYDCYAVCQFVREGVGHALGRTIGNIRKPPSNVYKYSISRYEDLKELYSWMYGGRDFSFCLQRKRDLFADYLDYSARRKAEILGNKSSQYRGVNYHKPLKKFVASYQYKNQRIHIGVYRTEIEAAHARDEAIIRAGLQGALRLNFPL